MEDSDSRKERFQGPHYEDPQENALHKRYLSMKQERELASTKISGRAVNLEDAVDIVGTCDMMCPEFESLQRYFADDLDPFERSPSGGYDRSLMVEIFKRAAAGTDLPPPEDIRPPPILRKTVDYLFDQILLQHGIEATHNFIWNRTRAIRNDLTRQRDHSENAIYCLERIVRFHILALHVVCRGLREKETMEVEQLKKALQSLTEVYQDARLNYSSPNEAEFRSYYILMHTRSRHVPFTLRTVPSWVYNSPTLQWALRLRFTVGRNTDSGDEHGSDVTQMDYSGFFDLVAHPATSYLSACLLEASFDDIRRQICLMLGLTLKVTARLMPLPEFQKLLRLDSEADATGWLTHLRWKLTPRGLVEVPQSRKADNLLPAIATADQYPRSRSLLVQAKRSSWRGKYVGSLDALLINGNGMSQIEPPILPHQRRSRIYNIPPPQSSLNPSAAPFIPGGPAVPFTASSTPFGPPAFASTTKPPLTASAKPIFNPFGPRPGPVPGAKPPGTSPTNTFRVPTTAPAQHFPEANALQLQSTPFKQPQAPSMSNPTAFKPAPFPIFNGSLIQTGHTIETRPQSSSVPMVNAAPLTLHFASKPPAPPITINNRRRSIITEQKSEDLLTDTTPPARPFEPAEGLSDGDTEVSAASSVFPASSHGEARDHAIIESNGVQDYGAESNASTDTELAEAPNEVLTQLQEQKRLTTLRSFVQQWREISAKGKDRTEELIEIENKRVKAEQSALDIPLEARFTDPRREFTHSISKKRIMHESDTTQTFMMAEKEAEDRKRVWTPKMFSRLASQAAKRKAAGKDLPAGWQIWVSFVPGGGAGAEWLKIKFAGDINAPDLSNISVGPPANGETVAAPGIIILHLEPGAWDDNLRRAKEVFDLLPGDSPYIPGLLLIMISDGIELSFPATWISKLDRMLRDVILDRRAVVFTSLESAQVTDDEFFTQVSELNFDIEGQAPRLELKELVNEYMNWWMVEFQYAFEQVFNPTPDFDSILLALSVLMSGLDEFLRQVLLQCRVTHSDIPFNNFQSKRDLESACIEILRYLSVLGGSATGIPSTPPAILQQPETLFKILLRIAETLKRRVLEYSDIWQLRAGLRRPLLDKLGKEYNTKLEQELQPIDRSKIIYSSSAPAAFSLNQSALKRKRRSSAVDNSLSSSVSSLRSSIGAYISPKRSRGTLEESTKADQPIKLSFKVQMAKARLDLQVLQAVDVERYQNDHAIAVARATTLAKIAEPLIEEVLRSDIPSDKAVIECRAVLELINGVQETVMTELCGIDKLVTLIERLGELKDMPGSLELRQLVFTANRLADRML